MPETEEEKAKREAEEEAARKAKEEEENSESEEELTPEQLKAQLDEQKKHIKALNKESADRRKKLEAFEKAEEERKQAELSEIDKVNAKAKQLEDEKATLAAENKTLKLERDFNSKVAAMKLTFANEKAAKAAFNALDLEVVGDDHSGLEDAIKTLVKEQSFYFGNSSQQIQTINDGSAKGKVNTTTTTAEAVEKKRKSVSPL